MSEKLHVLHAPEDVDLVGHVVDFLEAAFPSCKLTCTSFAGYKADPEKALRDADAVVAVISRGALLAATVPFELGVARSLGKPAIIIADDTADPTRLVLPMSSEHVALAETEESLYAVGRRLAATLGLPFRLGDHGTDPDLTPAPLPQPQTPGSALSHLADERRLRRATAESRAANDGTLTGIPIVKPAPFPRAHPTPQAGPSPLTELEIKAKAKVVEEAVARAVAEKARREGGRTDAVPQAASTAMRPPPSVPPVAPHKAPTVRRRRSSAPLPWSVNPSSPPSVETDAMVHDRITPEIGSVAPVRATAAADDKSESSAHAGVPAVIVKPREDPSQAVTVTETKVTGTQLSEPSPTAAATASTADTSVTDSPERTAESSEHAATQAPAKNGPSAIECFEAGRALGECLFHRDESPPKASELDSTFGVLIGKLGAEWSQLRENADLDLWQETVRTQLANLPQAQGDRSTWYELGLELSTLIGLSGREPAEGDAAARWQAAMDGFGERANALAWSPGQIAVIEGMLENLRGPSDERDYTYMNRIQTTVREIATRTAPPPAGD